ncbi:MAG: protein kinase, partial [Chloroflexota bacterium]
MQNLSGQKLGIYELRERLGRGGMAEVYKAYQPGMDRFVAIKIMLGHLADDDTFIERFKREARAVGKLRHPHIINIFDFGIQDDVYYMVMEYLTDGNLKEYIDSQQQLSVQASLKIARDLADALAYAHNAGMIHRDLKPANIMFIDKSKHEVVLTDFGIARILDATGLTGTGMSVGTPAYMSPEAGAGEDTDERADIYALGVILYEMLVGEAPYNADTPLAIIMKHINAPLPTRADYGDKIPEAVERIILRCLAKDADMRFKSAGELRDALDKAIHSSDSTSAQVARVNPVKTSVSSRSSKQTNAMMTDNPTSHMTTIGQSTDEELTKQSSSSPLLPIIGVLVTVIILGGLGFFFFDEFANNNNESTAEETFEDGAFAVWLGGELPPNPEANLSVFSNVSDYLNDAEELAFEGDLDGAIEFIEGILEDELDNADALFARSQLYTYRYDEDDVAGNTARRLIDLQPDSPWGYIALSDSFLNYPAFEDDNAGENALEALEMAHDIEADNPHIIWRLARLSNWDT